MTDLEFKALNEIYDGNIPKTALMCYEEYLRQTEINNAELMEDLYLEQLEQM